jgi:phosphatidate phosphatase LPIN
VSVESTIYLWSPHSKIVISDVDGTITKSDVLGHIFFFVGRDWTHMGVAQLYTNIMANGYNIVYLTSRAIGQTDATKLYLKNIKQFADAPGTHAAAMVGAGAKVAAGAGATGGTGGAGVGVGAGSAFGAGAGSSAVVGSSPHLAALAQGAERAQQPVAPSASSSAAFSVAPAPQAVQPPSPTLGATLAPSFALPPGPVITSPDRLFTAFTREVILRRPQEFKIAALRNILALFPDGSSPFCAGFGNRDTDVVAYRTVGVPEGRIFVINSVGEVQTHNRTFKKSYDFINQNVDAIFPLTRQLSAAEANVGARFGVPVGSAPEFSDGAFWGRTLPALTDEDVREANGRKGSAKKLDRGR